MGQRLSRDQLEHLGRWCVTVAELDIGSLIALAILEVQRDDASVMLLQERDRVDVRGGEVADVEIDGDVGASPASLRSRLFGVANSFGSIREWLCMPTGILRRAAAVAIRATIAMLAEAVISAVPSAVVISKPDRSPRR